MKAMCEEKENGIWPWVVATLDWGQEEQESSFFQSLPPLSARGWSSSPNGSILSCGVVVVILVGGTKGFDNYEVNAFTTGVLRENPCLKYIIFPIQLWVIGSRHNALFYTLLWSRWKWTFLQAYLHMSSPGACFALKLEKNCKNSCKISQDMLSSLESPARKLKV